LLSLFKNYLKEPASKISVNETADALHLILTIAIQFKIDWKILVQETTAAQFLLQAYMAIGDELSQISMQFDTYTVSFQQEIKLRAILAPILALSTESIIKKVKDKATSQIDTLTRWSVAHLDCATIQFKMCPALGLERYLAAFALIQERFKQVSANLYDFRVEAETVLREEGNYLKSLKELDADLTLIQRQFILQQKKWLEETEKLLPETDLAQASKCLQTLLHPSLLALESVSWAAHTAYCPARTEEKVAYEMNQRIEVDTKNYHLDSYCTISDYFLNPYISVHDSIVRAQMLKVHPDKFAKKPSLLPIANFCSQIISTKRKQCQTLTRAWRLSQWFDPKLFPDVPLALMDDNDAFQANVVENPQESITLHMLELKHEYLQWIKSKAVLEKSPQVPIWQNRLYDQHDDPLAILLFEKAKIGLLNVQQQLTQVHCANEVLRQQFEQNVSKLKLYNKKAILRLIKESVEELLVEPKTTVKLNELKEWIYKQVMEIFENLEAEVFDECFQEYIKSHVSTQDPALNAASQSPFVFFSSRFQGIELVNLQQTQGIAYLGSERI
jgi:hypothetical protein